MVSTLNAPMTCMHACAHVCMRSRWWLATSTCRRAITNTSCAYTWLRCHGPPLTRSLHVWIPSPSRTDSPHEVRNLSTTVAVSGNFVNVTNLQARITLRFARLNKWPPRQRNLGLRADGCGWGKCSQVCRYLTGRLCLLVHVGASHDALCCAREWLNTSPLRLRPCCGRAASCAAMHSLVCVVSARHDARHPGRH